MSLISVIIPVYNAEQSIIRALESVRNQSWKGEFEIIVINDGSTDNSKKIIENYKNSHPEMNICLIDQTNQGVSAARNAGLKIAKGEFIALLDSDDEWLAEKTEKQMNCFETDENIDFLASRRNDVELKFPYHSNQKLVEVSLSKLLIRNEITVPSVVFKRKIIDNTGFFQEDQNHAEDVDFYLRISKNNRLFILNESLVMAGSGKRSFGVSGLSADLKRMAEGYQQNLDRLYAAKRINVFQFYFYKLFYGLKYLSLVVRNRYQKK